MDSLKNFQVGVTLQYPAVGPLSLRERAGVRVALLSRISDKPRPLRYKPTPARCLDSPQS
jgi:hypothetical protein